MYFCTLFESENEWQKTEQVSIPLPRASRNFPDIKTRNKNILYNWTLFLVLTSREFVEALGIGIRTCSVFFHSFSISNNVKQGPSIPFLSRLSFNLTRCSFFFAKNAALTAFLSKFSILSTLYKGCLPLTQFPLT